MTVVLAYKDKDKALMMSDGLTCSGEYIRNTKYNKMIKFDNYILGFAGAAIILQLMDVFKTTRNLDREIRSKKDVYGLYLALTKLMKEHEAVYHSDKHEGSDFEYLILTKENKLFKGSEYGNVYEVEQGFIGIGSGSDFAESYIAGCQLYRPTLDELRNTMKDAIEYSASKITNIGGQLFLETFNS